MRGESCYDEMRFQYYPMVGFAEWAAVAGARGTVSWCRGLGLVGLLALVLWAPSSPALELVETPQVIGVSMRSLAARGDEAFARQWQAARLRGETGCRRHCAMIGRAVAAVLAAARGQSDFARGVDWRVAVSASGSAEAYAYPGGQIVVSEGLIDSLSLSEAQLAFVLAHEVAHVLLQHERQTLALADAMILPRGGLGLAVDGTSVYAIGGGWQRAMGFNERYDTLTNTWSSIPSPVPGQWLNPGIASRGSQVYAVGGWSGGYLDFNEAFQSTFRAFLPLGTRGQPGEAGGQ